MLLGTVAVVGLMAFVAVAVAGQKNGVFATGATTAPAAPSAPLDEAERILAHRYASGQISPEEYDRMLVILRR